MVTIVDHPDLPADDGQASDGTGPGTQTAARRGLPPWHPPLLAAWSVLALWASNVNEVPPRDGLRLLGMAVGAVSVAWLVLAVAARFAGVDRPVSRAALATTIGAAAVLLAGRVASGLEPAVGLAAIAAIAIVGIVVASRISQSATAALTTVLDVFTLVTVAMVTVPVVSTLLQPNDPSPVTAEGAAGASSGGTLDRDVYYIIPDRHPRADTAQAYHGIDLTPFQDALVERGFTIQDKARANYPRTAHSLTATWYMEYLPDLFEEEPADPSSINPLYLMLGENPLGEVMTAAGADYVHIGNWWWPTATASTATSVFNPRVPNEFTSVWRATTGVRWLASTDVEAGMDRRREQYEIGWAQLAELERVAALPHERPRFVLVHLTIPHPPMVYDADGSYVRQDTVRSRDDDENLGNQVAFIDSWLEEFVDQVVTGDEETDPIIVIQSDEGPNPDGLNAGEDYNDYADIDMDGRREKLATFSAWYLPGVDQEPPEDITGVNTWRFILDRYIDTDYGLLDDRVYLYLHNDDLYEFVDVTDDFD